jgi:hypothetical protein
VRPSLFAACCAGSLSYFVAPAAQAYERQWRAGADAGYAGLFDGSTASGYGAGAHLGYGLSDTFNAMLEVDGTRHATAGVGGMTIWSAGAGVAYTFDVARLVPYVGLLVAGYRLDGPMCVPVADGEPYCVRATHAPGFQIALGLDYQLDRNWAIGAQLRLHTIFAAEPVGLLAYETTMLRAEYVWGN